MVVCDTHALIFDALDPKRLGANAAAAIEQAHRAGELACADISLWEIAMLMDKGRLWVDAPAEEFLTALVSARGLAVLSITPGIAALAASGRLAHGDPADRLIAATAIANNASLITRDRRLAGLPGLQTIW
jgi:PIN domain nuclease of toxin-antitoxin system